MVPGGAESREEYSGVSAEVVDAVADGDGAGKQLIGSNVMGMAGGCNNIVVEGTADVVDGGNGGVSSNNNVTRTKHTHMYTHTIISHAIARRQVRKWR